MRKGFTLIETVLSTVILSAVIVTAMGSWLLFMSKSNRANSQSSLDLDARKVVERFRAEMRNSARETIIFYPEKQTPYKAVGFALASDSDNDGLMDMDASGSNILWRQTIVYHVYERSPTQMRRTVFSNRNTGASYSDYYGQIGSVVTAGNGASACLAGETAATDVLFSNLFTGKLWHAESTFDGYAPAANTLERLTFGSLSLGPGAHSVAFTVTDKNPASTGRRMRVDQLSASVSGWPLEAELRTATGIASAPLFVGVGLAGAAYGREASSAANGDSMAMTVYNDAIEECGFIGKGRNVTLSNTVVRFDTTLQPAGFAQGVYVTGLDGQYAASWDAGQQTGDGMRSRYFYPTNCAMRIPILAAWVTKDGYGPVFHVYKSLNNANCRLTNPVFSIVDTPAGGAMPSPDVPSGEFIPLIFYQDGVEKASWSACANQKYLELRPRQSVLLNQNTTLMVSFQVSVTTYKTDCFTACVNFRPGMTGCWYLPEGGSNAVTQAIWSTDPQVVASDDLPTLETMAVGFADGGDYVSHPFDSRSSAGAAKTLAWDADVPAGSSFTMYARSGSTLTEDGFGIVDAPEWTSVGAAANGGVVSGGTGRYLQFRAVATSTPFSKFPGETGGLAIGPYRNATPRLRRAFITWDGETKYVDIVANMLKGPDCGIFKVEVDGKAMVRGVTMEIEIYKDVVSQGGVKTERLRSAMMAEIEPRNSAKK
jgi:type II secretory pathway pseudopilin PulG